MINKPKYKICKRLGAGVFDKCQTQKFAVSEAKKSNKKGKKPKALSDYGVQFIEKQKIRYSYGVTEKQFSNYVKDAMATKSGSAADKLYEMLESRLDNVVYRFGLGSTRALARQIVSHGHLMVNGHRTTIPSYRLKVGDVIKIREGSKNKVLFQELPKKLKNYAYPAWLKFDAEKGEGEVIGKPVNSETFLNFNTMIEFYSR